MIADPKAMRLSDRFIKQWLRIEGLGISYKPDIKIFDYATPDLLNAMKEESVLFAHEIFKTDKSLLDFIDADFTYVNDVLAKHYGIQGIKGSEMQRVALTDKNRGGIITQASTLTVSSSPDRTSPVFRGKWILEVILGQHPPPPPPNIPELKVANNATPQGIREILKQHSDNASCSSCHNKIDPPGFALDAFDATGKLRTGEVDNKATLSDGTEFIGHQGLKEMIKEKKKDLFIRQITTKLLSYALGRELIFTDEIAIQAILKTVTESNNSSHALIEAIALSYPFIYRKEPIKENR
jgi:hypothetical protein